MTSYVNLPDNSKEESPKSSTTPLTNPATPTTAVYKKMDDTPTTPEQYTFSGTQSRGLRASNFDAAAGNFSGDTDSFSESEREKMDTTPENLKKIDDVIMREHDIKATKMALNTVQQQQQQQQQQYHHYQQQHRNPHQQHINNSITSSYDGASLACGGGGGGGSSTSSLSPRSDRLTSFGLAAAVDDSNAKFCLGKPQNKEIYNYSKNIINKDNSFSNQKNIKNIDNKLNIVEDEETRNENGVVEKENELTDQEKFFTDNKQQQQQSKATAEDAVGVQARVPSPDYDDSLSSSNMTTSLTATATTTTNNNNTKSCAFTIDNFNDKECDATVQAAKYKNMMERFQNRHRRGASLSKLETSDESLMGTKPTQTTTARLTSSQSSSMPLAAAANRNSARNSLSAKDQQQSSMDSETGNAATQKVKLRVRDRSTSRVRDAAKRHSWSPRSSTTEQQLQLAPQTQQQHQQHQHNSSTTNNQTSRTRTNASTTNRTSTTTITRPAPPMQLPKGSANTLANRTQFTPRSMAMQLALQNVDMLCPQPPLADFKHLNADADDVSEAGTYTLDGDNYTEEQKDLMNIDKNGQPIRPRRRGPAATKQKPHLELNLPTNKAGHMESKRANNVLEVNYYHEAAGSIDSNAALLRPRAEADLRMGSHQSANDYLAKIKSRVLRNMNATKQLDLSSEKLKKTASPPHRSSVQAPDDDEEYDGDSGCFTSVTTSGVLAKQRTLDARPKMSRHSGLSTSQIDSSEYVSNETKLKATGTPPSMAGGYTDLQKAEYRLNVFTNQKSDASQKFAATRNLIETPPETPTGPQPVSKLSEVAVLQTAQTKHDWIQEWARNARARSLANDRPSHQKQQQHADDLLMTRSYTCAETGTTESLTDDSIYSAQTAAAAVISRQQFAGAGKLNKSLAERYRLSGGALTDFDYTSDPSLSTSTSYNKPPKSPTKIPSPLHTLGRARSASRTRASLQNILMPGGPEDDDEDYLQQTAAVINSMQQSLSRKNSIKSPSHSASPRASQRSQHIIYSPEACGSADCSPQHTLLRQRQPGSTAQNLMTSSINEQQLQMLTSGEYLLRQMRNRKNSFDGQLAGNNSPHRRLLQQSNLQSPTAEQDPSLSPLRRSSSFSARVAATQRAARPNYQNLYTPPAARHSYGLSVAPQRSSTNSQQMQAAIKKSASSNNFGQAYSDYDDNLQYYINDEDDNAAAAEDYDYSSGAEEDEYYPDPDSEQSGALDTSTAGGVPLSNTRYNKALLMRIERSKQKVQGNSAAAVKPRSAPPTKTTAGIAFGGAMACPNTPELPRRNIKSASTAARSSMGGGGGGVASGNRQSMPRDTSLSRLAQQVPTSLASAKKQLLQTAANAIPSNNSGNSQATATTRSSSSQRAQPRYLDISKYKPAQGNQFLRKNDAKSTLKPSMNNNASSDVMKRSPSASSMGLSRADPSRASNRSVRSATSSVMTSSATSLSGRASSAVRRDASATKQKEAEMAMWKRRSKYDPMKAAAEDRRKKEEAKRLAQTQQIDDLMVMPTERPSRSLYRRDQL